jgi:hypothetical protein
MSEPPSLPVPVAPAGRDAEGASAAPSPPLPATSRTPILVALGVLGLVLTATVVPSIFTLDESNYLATVLALRQRSLALRSTEGLSPTFELYAFDPAPFARPSPSIPVAPNGPPLYGPLALPLSYLGWRGLVLLNTAGFVVAAYLVFLLAARRARRRTTPWLAVAAFALCGYSLEYAQGMWPQMLSVALCLGCFAAAARARRDRASLAIAFAAGLLGGLATGIRYQNLVLAGAVGLGLLLGGSRRLASLSAYAAGCSVPLLASSWTNHVRLGSWNPVSKGSGYLMPGVVTAGARSALTEPFQVLLAKVVDFTFHPPTPGWRPEASGAFVAFGAVKKALLQSSPWIAVAFAAMLLAWRGWRPRARAPEPPGAHRPELRALSLPIAAVLGLFATQGFIRTDGLGFNQRYFLELVPLAAIAFASGLDEVDLDGRALGVGAALGALAAGLVLALDGQSAARHVLLSKLPLLLAAGALGAWLALRAGRARAASWAALGASLAWAFAVHVGDDVRASREVRAFNAAREEELAAALPDRAAVFAVAHWKDPYAPLQLERDLLVADPSIDGGRDAARLAGELLAQGRRVLVDVSELPPPMFERIRGAHGSRLLTPERLRLVELVDDGR